MENLATKTAEFWEYFNHLVLKKHLLNGDDYTYEVCESLNNVVFENTKKLLSLKYLMHVVDKVNSYHNTNTTFEDLIQSTYFLGKFEGIYYFDVVKLQQQEKVRMLVPTATSLKKVEFLDCQQTIDKINGIIKQREVAINYYPHAFSYREQNDAISRLQLRSAELFFAKNDLQKARIMLRMETDLLFIAPRSTIKIFTTYTEKVNSIMCLLREVLGLKKQN